MHHTQPMPRTSLALVLTGLLLGATARAADETAPMPREAAPSPPARNGGRGIPLVIAVNGTHRLSMRGGKVIATVINTKDNIAVVAPDPQDPRTVLVTGREAGTTRITLVANDHSEEIYDVVVEFDVEYLRSVIQRAAPSASVVIIPSANGTLILAGNVEKSEDVDVIMRVAQSVAGSPERVINAMRVGGVMQVQLDVIVAYVSRNELRRMSFDFLSGGAHHNLSSTVGGALVNPTTGSPIPSLPGVALPIDNVVGSPNGNPANIFFGLFNNEQVFFGFLQALRNEGLAKITAQPKLVVLSGRPAHMISGGRQAIPETAGLGSVSVRFEAFGTTLDFLPVVLGNGKIHLEVTPQVESLDPANGTSISGTIVAGRATQMVQTTVEIEDGQTLAIGGLIQHSVSGSTSKVPVLGDIPFLGVAFSSKSYNETEQELVVLVTPHLVDPMSCDQLPKYLPGQETRTPDDFELFLEGILEAPRGPRDVCHNRHYVPAYKNGPTAGSYPCAGDCGRGGPGACNGTCYNGTPTAASAAVVRQPAPTSANGPAPVATVPPASTGPRLTLAPLDGPPVTPAVANGPDAKPSFLPPVYQPAGPETPK